MFVFGGCELFEVPEEFLREEQVAEVYRSYKAGRKQRLKTGVRLPKQGAS